MKKNQKIAVGLISGFVVLVAAFIVVWAIWSPKPIENPSSSAPYDKTITVQIVYSDETSETKKINTNANNLRGALEDEGLVSGTESEYGLFITTVNGVTADDSKQQWWFVTKDGEDVMTGVDSTPIEDGDKFELTLKTGW